MKDGALLRAIITEAAQSTVGTSLTFVEQERVVSATMERLRGQLGGSVLRLYIPKTATTDKARRAREIRALTGVSSVSALASRYGISERQVRRIVGDKPSAKGTSST
jgi:Mor family transcriptional regulator